MPPAGDDRVFRVTAHAWLLARVLGSGPWRPGRAVRPGAGSSAACRPAGPVWRLVHRPVRGTGGSAADGPGSTGAGVAGSRPGAASGNRPAPGPGAAL